jgi:heptosyltransferase-3
MMTPALTAARELWPDAQIDVLVRSSTEGILSGCPAINNIYTSAPPEGNMRGVKQLSNDIQVALKLRQQQYDWIFEMGGNDRGRIMTIAVGGKNRVTHTFKEFPLWARPFFNRQRPFFNDLHRCEKDVDLLWAFCNYQKPAPPMQYDRAFADWSWVQYNVTTAPIVVHAVSRWKSKMWPADKWKVVVKRLAEYGPVVLSSGPKQEEISITREIAEVNPKRISITGGSLDWPQMAGLLYSSRMLVTVDTATMHLGAACQVPMVVIFGPTNELLWRPWACQYDLLLAPEVPSKSPYDRVIADVELEDVWVRCEQLLNKLNSRKRQST